MSRVVEVPLLLEEVLPALVSQLLLHLLKGVLRVAAGLPSCSHVVLVLKRHCAALRLLRVLVLGVTIVVGVPWRTPVPKRDPVDVGPDEVLVLVILSLVWRLVVD